LILNTISMKGTPMMKKTIALMAASALAVPLAAMAQTGAAQKPLTQRVGQAAKNVARKVTPKPIIKKLEERQPVHGEIDEELSEETIQTATRVHTGMIPCELGASVTIEADAQKPGFFTLMHAGKRYRMHPVESRTGALRLEDARAGAMWLQLGNKSMLMSQKLGLRLADQCQAIQQVEVAEEMKRNPPPALFEGADSPAGVALGPARK
jgi:hypothetical protein